MAEYDRPSIVADICEQIANGKSLREICEPEHMPAPSTVVGWMLEDKALAEQYAHARERQADFYADEIIEIADKAKNEDAQVARLRVDARKWKASKLAPKRYGDKLDLNHGGHVKIEGVRRTIHDPRHTDGEGVPPAS